MESSSLVGDFLSPESTVTSLLSSSGVLRSSLRPPEHNTTFRYREQDYDSASAALDAYIADFERSRQNSKSSTGGLVLPHNPPYTPSRPRVSTLRNKDVLRERLTDRELDFLNLPVSSLHHRSNRDRLSMTTNELLSIPYDGSMPVTHTSAFIQGLLSQSGASQPRPSSSRPAPRPFTGLSSSHGVPHHVNHHDHHHSLPARTPRSSRCRGRPGVVTFEPRLDISVGSRESAHRAEWAEPSSSLHLPRWFTSNKADMDCSRNTNVPDLKCPAWVQSCDLSEPPPLESELWYDHGVLPPGPYRTGPPSWVADLVKDDDPDQTPTEADSQLTLRDLRLQFAEQISVLAAERQGSDIMTTLFRDNKIESLIQKADQVLSALSQSSGGAEGPADPASPVDTEQLLHCSPSRCPPLTRDSAAGGFTEAPTDGGVEAQGSGPHEDSLWKQPGPVEALKQMLFRLQAVEAELQRQQQQAPAAPALADRLQTPEKQWPDGEEELQSVTGRPSLQRALHHLSRLKLLVEEPRQKRKQEEKDEDEGRYSSSSADRLICSQQEPS